MNITAVTQDVGNGNSLRLIGAHLEKMGHQVEGFFGGGKPLPEGSLERINESLKQADRLLVSFSSAESRTAEERHAMQEAVRLGVPIAVFSDIYGMYNRPWFSDLLPKAGLLFVIDENEVKTAESVVGPNTRIVHAANPYWAEFFKVKFDREEVRSKLGIDTDETMILVSGSKELERNRSLFRDVAMTTVSVESLSNIKLRVVLTTHPGANHGQDAYEDILGSARPLVSFAPKETGLSTQDMVAGSDLVITGGGSTITLMAACQRVLVVDLMHDIDKIWWKELSGLGFWPPAKSGVSALAESLKDIGREILFLTKPSAESERMRKIQREEFSLAKFENAAEKIASELVS
ncbi:MAG: hypothetical protein AAB597_00350 [Patescibacteria group bacterium]